MKYKTKITILMLILFASVFGLGWSGNDMYREYKYKADLYGLRFIYNNSHFEAVKYAENLDKLGDWICVNIKGMTYQKAVEVCQHEAAHEIFAEILEKNPEKINDVMEVVK